ncbi:MAG: SHOCT domain-containing protein [Bacillota bacterium]|nr:SHOCT domain-containing protein [Bacillota bacterium]
MNLELTGRQGKSIVVEGNTVKIIKKGKLFSAKREKTLPIRNISSVEVKKPGLAVGFIQFSIAGGVARDSSAKLTGGAFDAVNDENSVIFADKKAYEVALKIKEYIESFSESAAVVTKESAADELVKFKKLLDDGVINQDEFNTKKKQLLGL